MPSLFISYRRKDEPHSADRLYEALCKSFGPTNVFKDVDSIQPSEDFELSIHEALQQSDSVVALIGPSWEGPLPNGKRRIDDQNDLVRKELELALALGKRIIPVLVTSQEPLSARALPPSLAPLTRMHSAPLRVDPDFQADVARISTALRGHQPAKPRVSRRAASLLVFLAIASLLWFVNHQAQDWLNAKQEQGVVEHTEEDGTVTKSEDPSNYLEAQIDQLLEPSLTPDGQLNPTLGRATKTDPPPLVAETPPPTKFIEVIAHYPSSMTGCRVLLDGEPASLVSQTLTVARVRMPESASARLLTLEGRTRQCTLEKLFLDGEAVYVTEAQCSSTIAS